MFDDGPKAVNQHTKCSPPTFCSTNFMCRKNGCQNDRRPSATGRRMGVSRGSLLGMSHAQVRRRFDDVFQAGIHEAVTGRRWQFALRRTSCTDGILSAATQLATRLGCFE